MYNKGNYLNNNLKFTEILTFQKVQQWAKERRIIMIEIAFENLENLATKPSILSPPPLNPRIHKFTSLNKFKLRMRTFVRLLWIQKLQSQSWHTWSRETPRKLIQYAQSQWQSRKRTIFKSTYVAFSWEYHTLLFIRIKITFYYKMS